MLHHYIYTILTLSLLFSLALSLPKNLTFNSEGTFTILQLTDLHYGEYKYTDENNMRLQAELIDRVKPDIVIVTGDVVSGYAYHGQPNFFEDAWTKFGKAFIDSKTYYAFAMGNHDAQDDTLPEDIFELEKNNPYSLCLHSQHLSHETFNYYLPVYSSLKESNMSALLWIFDSHSVGCVEDTNSWGCVSDEQVQWYKQHSEQIKSEHGSDIHHLGFFHIPFPEYMDLYNDYEFYGHRNEDVSCPLLNTGFFDAIKQEGDIQAVFVGHDHLNDYGGWIDGVELVYGRRMGYAGYGELVGFQRGARVIKLTEKLAEDNTTIDVTREHYVIVEYPDKEKEEERLNEKVMKRRKGPKQQICVLGKGEESFWLALVWLAFSAILIGAVGAGVNRLIGFVLRKKNKEDIEDNRMIPKEEEFTRLDGEWAI